MKDKVDFVVAAVLIGLMTVAVMAVCLVLWPIRLLIDCSARKFRSLCPSCAGLDRRAWYELFYRPGNHTCGKCGTVTTVALTLLMLTASLHGQSDYQFYLNGGESAANGTQVTTNILNTDTKTNNFTGLWTITPSPHTAFAVTNQFDNALRASLTVGSSFLNGSGDVNTFQVRANGSTERACQFTFGATNCGQYSVGFYFRYGVVQLVDDSCDVTHMDGNGIGDFAVVNLRTAAAGQGGPVLRIHTLNGTGPGVSVTSNTTYWVTFLYDTNSGSTGNAKLAVFDPSTWRIIGIDSLAFQGKCMAEYFKFGILNGHVITQDFPLWFDDIMMETGAVAVTHWPLLPVGGTIQAATASRTDFNTAYTNAQSYAGTNKDMIAIPSGSATWTSGYTIAKNGINIKGAGTNSTIITGDNGASAFTVFTFNGNYNNMTNLQIKGDGSNDEITAIDNSAAYNVFGFLRITECDVAIFDRNPGLLHHSVILDSRYIARNINGNSFYNTWNPLPLDSTNAFYYEDCVFKWTPAKNGTGPDAMFSSQEGQSFVIRHCLFEITQAGTAAEPCIDYHGDWDPGSDPVYRPGTMLQVYSNVFNWTQDAPSAHGAKFVDVRGGPGTMIYSNKVIAGNYASGDGIVYREEHMFDDATPYTLTNAYNFNNTQPNGPIPVNNPLENGGQVFAGREYTNVAPSVLVQLTYPHPASGFPPPPPNTTPACCGASTGTGRSRNVIIGRQ